MCSGDSGYLVVSIGWQPEHTYWTCHGAGMIGKYKLPEKGA